MTGTQDPASTATLLDCTIRDGSYAIDFKFTADDTALIAGLLADAGLKWIEIGHGLGLGASEAGKGRAASHDIEAIERTRERVADAKIGVFFIPGIGTEAHLRDAAKAGLDFVRIGQNADEIETIWPFVEAARDAGLEVFVNFMKTYGIEPERFARHAAEAHANGAIGAYVVDSAGGMLPSEVEAYVRATRAASDITVGFHGHSNLHLAVANSIAAHAAGAEFVDTSVYGIGRSSGNVPTEVMAAVFERMGIDCGVDALAVIDMAESYLRPVAEHLHPHTMIAVSLGYGRFHSSYLERAVAAAEQAGVNPFRLIVELGRQDMMRLPDELLERTVARLADEPGPPERRLDVARFSDERFAPGRFGNRPQAVAELLDGLEVVARKRALAVVLDLVPSPTLPEESTIAEFVLEDDEMALGRVRFGAATELATAVSAYPGHIDLALLRADRALTRDELTEIRGVFGSRLAAYRAGELELGFLRDAVLATALSAGADRVALCDPGSYDAGDVSAFARELDRSVLVERVGGDVGETTAPIIAVAGPVGSVTGAALERPGTVVLFLGGRGDAAGEAPLPAGWHVLEREDAYRGTLGRWRRAAAVATGATRLEASPL